MSTKRAKQIDEWKAALRLTNDARYWDLCRTYGDHSLEVYLHLKTLMRYLDNR